MRVPWRFPMLLAPPPASRLDAFVCWEKQIYATEMRVRTFQNRTYERYSHTTDSSFLFQTWHCLCVIFGQTLG